MIFFLFHTQLFCYSSDLTSFHQNLESHQIIFRNIFHKPYFQKTFYITILCSENQCFYDFFSIYQGKFPELRGWYPAL